MSKKVLNVLDGCHLECIRTDDKCNPYRVYRIAGGHHRQLAKFDDFMSVLFYIQEFYIDGMDTMTTPQVLAWAKDICGNGSGKEVKNFFRKL